jgi:hypothetical protein
MTTKRILEAAMKLPKRDKLRLARKLNESAAQEDVLIAGVKEAERAFEAYQRGEMGAKPAEEVIRRLLKRKSKIPRKARVLLAEELIEGLDEREEIIAAAQLAEKRIKLCQAGKMKTIEEEEIMDMLRTKSSS